MSAQKRYRKLVERAEGLGLGVNIVVGPGRVQVGDVFSVSGVSASDAHDLEACLDDLASYIETYAATEAISPILDEFEARWPKAAR